MKDRKTDFTSLLEQKSYMESTAKKWDKMIENKKYGKIRDRQKYIVSALFEAQEREVNKVQLSESSQAGDITGVTPMLIPVLRRMIPAMLAFDICGVQPMSAPTGLVFAIRPVFHNTTNEGVKRANSVIVTLSVTDGTDNGAVTNFVAGVEITDNTSGATGKIVFKPSADSSLALVKVVSGTFGKGNQIKVSDDASLTITLNAVDTNVAMYKNLLTGYAGSYETSYAEYLGNDIREMGFTIESTSVTAKTMNLKAHYTVELEQDLKNLHSLNASEELQTFLSQEIATEINADLLDRIKAGAKEGGEYLYNYDMNVSNGRWMMEKFRAIVHIIEVAANDIYITTRRGKGNILICSPNVVSILSQLTGFYSYNPSLDTLGSTQLNSNYSPTNGFAGVFNSMRVFVDPWATEEYAVVGYKGESEFDAGLFYCPYTPVQSQIIPDPVTGQNVIHFKTRYGVAENPFQIKNFFRYISVVDLPLNILKDTSGE